jgi:hypothetical protein
MAHDLEAFDNFIDIMMDQSKMTNGTPQNLGEWTQSIQEERQGEEKTPSN